jgi:vacuolar-type H+-ATPase subunit C/Vma6
MTWDDLNARVRGLAGHLLGRATIESLASEPDVESLARRLRDGPYDAGLRGAVPSATAIDLSVRRAAAARLITIAKWAGSRAAKLRVVFEDEDRRSIRALLRGAVAGVRAETRLAGLVPTPELPERALEELARQATAAKVAALLVAWGNPLGSAIFEQASASQPDLFLVELELAHAFARRARSATRNPALRRFTQDAIDAENAASAVVLAGRQLGIESERAFLPGGRRIAKGLFLHAAGAEDADLALNRLARVDNGRSGWALAFAGAQPETLERVLLRMRIASQRRVARELPLSPALVLGYLLRLRSEVIDLRTITWGLGLRAPRPLIVDQLVTT